SFNENTETTSENEEYISDINDNSLQDFNSIPDVYRPLSKASGSTGNIWDHLSSIYGITKENSLKLKD
ncbi:2761_t:CDS:2, partial [Racocetra fulgida]